MFKRAIILLILFCVSEILFAQDIRYFFKILPQTYTPELNAKAKISLLKKEKYYPPTNDSVETVVYNMEELDTVNNFLFIGMGFESRQRGFSNFELRSFKTKNGNSIVVFSNYSGVPVDYSQKKLVVFSFAKNNSLVRISSLGFPTKVSIEDFFKPNTPDSIKKKYKGYCSVSFDLSGKNISLGLNCPAIIEELDKWVTHYPIEFIWNGESFIKQKPKFEE